MATVLRFGGFPLPPLIIGFILGGMLEDNLGRAMRKAGGLEFMWERPMTLGILLLALALLVYPILKDRKKAVRE
jgi:putative tricarboxylic transport membrane protein